ncbi:MAG: ABC transporter ATP-binding protein, partial [Candidatus Nanopelagicales bacterium]|nr:ABC transporter ATP-binding protein [Candidatus Nanopelagicales bacterium]
MSNAVELREVGKRFKRMGDRRDSLKERIVRGRGSRAEDFWAVRNISFDVQAGSVYGLIGHNGSGKSTLLKMIGGIYRPTEGSITAQGRVASLIELGAGFHPDMSGRENIALNGSILGLSRKEIAEVTGEIINFSGLAEFINEPVKHYSSGMYVRLGFAVAVHMKPDVLLVDEVLAVGDEEFQRKCFDHLYALRRSGRTIIVVSHGLGQLEGLCDEIAWLERGELQQRGQAVETIAAYLARVNADEAARNPMVSSTREGDLGARAGDQTVQVLRADIVDADGAALTHAMTGTTFRVRLVITTVGQVLGPNVRIALQHESGPLVAMINNHAIGVDFSWIEGAHDVEIDIVGNPLLPGRYRVHVDVFDHTGT